MNSSFHRPAHVDSFPSSTTLFTLKHWYASCEEPQYFRYVHVPESLRSALATSKGFHTKALAVNGPASSGLPDSPMCAVVGVVACDGLVAVDIRNEWTQHKRRLTGLAGISAAAAVPVTAYSADWASVAMACVLASIATIAWERRAGVSIRPFNAYVEFA